METVPPKDDGLATFVLAIIMLVVCWPTVIARFIIRFKAKVLGLDDWLMGLGMVMATAWSGVLIVYCFSGGGYDQNHPSITDTLAAQALKFYFICQSVYCPTTIPVKLSICVALLRISGTVTVYKWSLYAIIFLTVLSGIGSMIGIVASCSPPSAFWDPSTGVCNALVNTFAAYFISACSIITDIALAVLPGFMLWNIQLRRSIKISVGIILGLGAFASCAVLVRLRYLLALLNSENFILESAKIAIWTVIELTIGIFAGSLPALRPLLRFLPFLSRKDTGITKNPDASGSQGLGGAAGRGAGPRSGSNHVKLDTFESGAFAGSVRRQPRGAGDKDGLVLEDGDSQEYILQNQESGRNQGIRRDISVRVESSHNTNEWDLDQQRKYYYKGAGV